jgi:hypothetical protein
VAVFLKIIYTGFLMGKPKGRRKLGRLGHRREDNNIKMDF